jgi:Uncharacterized conserved protein
MSRASTKPDLLESANEQFTKLWDFIDTMPEAEQQATFLFEDRDRNVRDVLVHLYEWHQLLLKWIRANQIGTMRPFLTAPYNWRTYPQMNIEIWQKHQDTPYQEARELLKQSHADVMVLLEKFSNEELFTKKYFTWTGSTNLGSYCVSATSSHYEWAIKKLKQHRKTIREKNGDKGDKA